MSGTTGAIKLDAARWLGVVGDPERLLRWSLGIVYLWFGALKLVEMSPVLGLVRSVYTPLASVPLYCALTLFEIALGLVFLTGAWTRWAGAAAVFHLIGTLGAIVSSPRRIFLPYFPFLTMEGEFVVKNLVLLAAALSLCLGVRRAVATVNQPPRLWKLALVLIVAGGVGFAGAWLHGNMRAAAQRSATGAVAKEIPLNVQTAKALIGRANLSAVLTGMVDDHCRLVGCWLTLRDETGELFVDLAPSGLSTVNLPPGSRVRVTGHLGTTRDGGIGFIAPSITRAGQSAKHLQPAVPAESPRLPDSSEGQAGTNTPDSE